MFKFFLIQVFFTTAISLFAQEVSGIYYSVGENTKYVSANILNVRSGPGIEYEVIDKLKLGDEVVIPEEFKSWENTDTYTQNGLTTFWLPVSYQKDGIQKEGYVWQGNLSFTQMRRENTKFIFGANAKETIKEKDSNDYDYIVSKYKMELKILENDSLLATKTFFINTEETYVIGKVFKNLGLQNVKNIIRISALGEEACGIPSQHYYFAWNGKEILELPSRYSVSDAGIYYYVEELIFPLEKGGKPNKIIKISEQGEFDEEDENLEHPRITKKTEEFLWNGKTYKKIK